MRFEPKTAKEVAEAGLFPAGEYDFEVLSAVEGVSKASGNEMITLKLKIFDEGGNFIVISDYLLESIAYKLRHACEATGLLGDYESGSLDAHGFDGKTGRLKLRIDKDKSGQYPDKNGVQDYIARDIAKFGQAPVAKPRQQPKQLEAAGMGSYTGRPDLDDEIPF